MKSANITDYADYDSAVSALEQKDKRVKSYRQMAKAPNFGYPGGMGPGTFIEYARSNYGLILTLDKSRELKEAWLETYPEMQQYFKYIGSMESGSNGFTIRQLSTDRVRSGAAFCPACNSPFQGLTADGAKRGIIKTGQMCYGDEFFLGCSQKLFVHDEILFQIPDYEDIDKRQAVIDKFSYAMTSGMQEVMPGMKVCVEATLSRRWSKEAETILDDKGRLMIYEG